MGANIRLRADDGHEFDAYVAESSRPTKSAMVLLQEIFGVNGHIRSVAEDYAQQGFLVVAPALFDRVQPHLELGYDPADAAVGIRVATQIGLDTPLRDIAASMAYALGRLSGAKVAVVGFCLGGTLAWLSSTRLNPAAAVAYYGGRIPEAEIPRCPIMLHFGDRDNHIPASKVDAIQKLHPDLPIFRYDAGHGFNCDQRRDFDAPAAALARQRTLEFLRQNLSDN